MPPIYTQMIQLGYSKKKKKRKENGGGGGVGFEDIATFLKKLWNFSSFYF